MDVLYDFQPFVFSTTSTEGRFVEGLPLKTPIGEYLDSHGRICGLFDIRFPAMLPIEKKANQVLGYFSSLYYGRDCQNVHDHLLSCLLETQVYIEKSILEFNGIDGIDFSLSVGVLWGSVLYVGRFGGSVGLRIYRRDTFGSLFQIDKTSGSHSIISVSGYIEPDDVVVFYNDQVDQSRFPVSTSSLIGLDAPHVYARLTGYFDAPILQQSSACVCGVYLQSFEVPSVEDERIIFKDINASNDASEIEPIDAELDIKIAQDNLMEREKSKLVFSTPSVISNFNSKIFSSFHAPKVLTFFTHQRIFIISCMMLILFVGLVVSGKDYEKIVKNEKALEQQKLGLLPQIDTAYKQGLYYAELNPERSKEYLKDAKKLLAQFSSPTPDISKLINDVDAAYASVTKTYLYDSVQAYFDLSVVNTQAIGSKIGLANSQLVVSDLANSAVYEVGTENRSANAILGSSAVSGLIGADGFEGNVYAVSKQGIARYREKDSKVSSMLEAQSSWGNIVDISVFGNGVYLLDKQNNQIWKYIPDGDSFGPVRNYISSDNVVGLSDATSFSIDGNVWVGTSKGEVIKFYSGKRDNFTISGVDGELGNIAGIYADSDSDYLYVYDNKVGRIVVLLKKDGSYVSSYQSKSFEGGDDIVVDVKNNYLYVLNKQKIFRIEIREKSSTQVKQ